MGSIAPEKLAAVVGDSMTYYVLVAPGAISAQMGAAVAFDAHVDGARMARALRLLLDSEPVLGYRFIAGAGGPAWELAERTEAEVLLPIHDTTDPDADAIAFVGSAFDPCEGPQVRGVMLRSPETDTLVLQVSHVAVDGRGVIETLYRLSEIYRSLSDDPSWVPDFNAGADRGCSSAAAGVGLSARMGTMKQLATPNPAGDWKYPDSGKRAAASHVFGVIESDVFRALKDKGRARGATVNDLLLTAYHRALCRALHPAETDSTPISMVVDLREYLSPTLPRGLTGFSAFWGAEVPFVDGEDFDGTLARVVEQTSAWKLSGVAREKAVASATSEAIAGGWRMKMLRPMYLKMGDMIREGLDSGGAVAPMLTNIGLIDPERLGFGDGVGVERCRWFCPITKAAGCMGVATFRERLEVCMGADAKTADAASVQEIVDGTIDELRAWAV